MRVRVNKRVLSAAVAMVVAAITWFATLYWLLFIFLTSQRHEWIISNCPILAGLMQDTLPPALAFIVALIVYHLLARRKPVEQPSCPDCGYLLRGIAEPRCPECGRRI